jgi:hypothetical protein
MKTLKIEILNPRALTMIKEMQALNLIKVSNILALPCMNFKSRRIIQLN